jgi:4-amino-4-deoxy-L-arabinose transferase-like glycosyltransferase
MDPAAAAERRFAITPATPKLVWAGVAVATVLGLGLRAAFVGDQSLGYEEVFTASVTGHPTLSGVWRAVRATESTPPLYYLLTWLGVTLSGLHSAVGLRMISLLAGSVTVPVAFLAMRRFVGSRAALAVAWLFAISPLLVEYSIYARSYGLLVLLVTLSLWAFGALLERPSLPRWSLWGAAAAASLWTHYFAGFIIAGQVIVLFVRLPRERARLLSTSAATVAAFAPLWSLLRAQSGNSSEFDFITARPLVSRLGEVAREFAMGTNVPWAWLEGTGIAITALALAGAALATHRRAATQVLVSVGAIGIALPVLATLVGLGDYLLPRNVIGISVCLAPLVAYGLTRGRGVPLAAYSAVCLAALLAGQTNWRYQGSTDWAGASRMIRGPAAGDPIAVMPAMELLVAAYYLHRPPLIIPIRAADLWVIVEPARGAHQRALAAVSDPPLTRLFGPGFRPVGELDYRGFRMIDLRSSSTDVVSPAPTPPGGSPGGPLAFVLAP